MLRWFARDCLCSVDGYKENNSTSLLVDTVVNFLRSSMLNWFLDKSIERVFGFVRIVVLRLSKVKDLVELPDDVGVDVGTGGVEVPCSGSAGEGFAKGKGES